MAERRSSPLLRRKDGTIISTFKKRAIEITGKVAETTQCAKHNCITTCNLAMKCDKSFFASVYSICFSHHFCNFTNISPPNLKCYLPVGFHGCRLLSSVSPVKSIFMCVTCEHVAALPFFISI